MKVNIWVHRNDIIKGKISKHSYTRPYQDRNEEWVQIEVTQDEFVQLEDKETQYSASVDGPGLKIEKGRSDANYTYPEFIEKHYNR